MHAEEEPHLWVVGLGQLALPQEQLQIPPGHERQQHHGLLSVLCAHVTDGQQIPEGGEKHGLLSLIRGSRMSMMLMYMCGQEGGRV